MIMGFGLPKSCLTLPILPTSSTPSTYAHVLPSTYISLAPRSQPIDITFVEPMVNDLNHSTIPHKVVYNQISYQYHKNHKARDKTLAHSLSSSLHLHLY